MDVKERAAILLSEKLKELSRCRKIYEIEKYNTRLPSLGDIDLIDELFRFVETKQPYSDELKAKIIKKFPHASPEKFGPEHWYYLYYSLFGIEIHGKTKKIVSAEVFTDIYGST